MDESSEKKHRFSKRKRAALMMLPFLLLLLSLGILNIWARSVLETMPEPTKAVGNVTAVATQAAPLKSVTPDTQAIEATETEDALPTLAATAAPPPTTTPIPLPITATITLLGPPDQSRVLAEDNITVYWTWPLPLAEDQFFGIYLQEASGESRIGRLEEANFGSGYRWQTEAQYLTDAGGEVNYLIKLESILTDEPLHSSEPRTLFILDSNN